MAVSVMALVRYERRAAGDLADSAWERIMDEHFDDNRMEKIYPNAIER